MVVVRSVRIATFDGRRKRRLQLRQQRLDAIHNRNDVRAGLPLDVDDHRRHGIHPRGLVQILGAVDDGRHILQPDRRAVLVSDDDRLVAGAGQDLIVGADGVRLPQPVEVPFGLVEIRLVQSGAKIFQAQPISRQRVGFARMRTAGF